MKKKAVIIGAGPAGLTAGYDLLDKSDEYDVEIYEATSDIGGISKTINYKGNRIDLGGHRFFSKSDKVMNWWTSMFPIYKPKDPLKDRISLEYVNAKTKQPLKHTDSPKSKTSNVFLSRRRISRIFFNGKFFNYPLSFQPKTFIELGIIKSFKILLSYIFAKTFPRKEKSLADFYTNKFGYELYNTFFSSYTERLWGTKPENISPEWGAQRVKGVSLKSVFLDSIQRLYKKPNGISQKNTETSLITKFLYPKYGPGQFWEHIAQEITKKGGTIYMNKKVVNLEIKGNSVTNITIQDEITNKKETIKTNLVISTAPIKDLIKGMKPKPPNEITDIAYNLEYRDFLTIGVLLKKLNIKNTTNIDTFNDIIPDNWIYVHQKGLKVLRIQFFNNWSPYMVKEKNKIWIGMEYTMTEGEDFWKIPDSEITKLGAEELESMGIACKQDIIDSFVIRTPKAYPAYFGTYKNFSIVRNYLDGIENLYLIGRNGMHRYNNMDHSMLTAFEAVKNILSGTKSKNNIWEVNTEKDYHESTK